MYLIIGDLHIGDDRVNDNLPKLFSFLNNISKTDCSLVLNGDIIDWQRYMGFDERHRLFFKILMKFKSIIYIIGNHDWILSGLKDCMPNVVFVDSLEFNEYGKRIKILHGHNIDFFAKKWPTISSIVIKLNSIVYKITGIDVEREIKRIKIFRKYFFDKQEKKLIDKYRKNFDILVSGHTHSGNVLKEEGFIYINNGDWIDDCIGIKIDNGTIEILKA
jgi:UDP-2,3-diacylglucosamine pyrophosphatase LpxH